MEIRKLLVANRGEIALRVFRACAAEGIGTIAVVAPDDRGSLHAREAGEVVEIAGYLHSEEHIRAAKQTGADAIHPGYGFLAESADFAEAVEAAGLVFVGPTPEALRRGGDKLEAKGAAESAGVPVLPTGEPEKIGFPLMVKAAAGGGGRGMRVVREPAELADAVAAAGREAKAAFGDETLFFERYLERPRHVEIQLLADEHGHVYSLGERECSIQRRHQKVLEEAPSPALDPDLRKRMSEAAIAFARAIGYRSLGTVEFLLDGSDFFFLELNGRIQVEHPVTEEATGLDLVALQLAVARGGQLDDPQASFRRHAVEVRLYAEDEADRLGRHAAGGARPARQCARRDRGRGRHDQPALPALARRAPGRSSRADDDRVPDRVSSAVGRADALAGRSLGDLMAPQPASTRSAPGP